MHVTYCIVDPIQPSTLGTSKGIVVDPQLKFVDSFALSIIRNPLLKEGLLLWPKHNQKNKTLLLSSGHTIHLCVQIWVTGLLMTHGRY